jgi:hypothetical protein
MKEEGEWGKGNGERERNIELFEIRTRSLIIWVSIQAQMLYFCPTDSAFSVSMREKTLTGSAVTLLLSDTKECALSL